MKSWSVLAFGRFSTLSTSFRNEIAGLAKECNEKHPGARKFTDKTRRLSREHYVELLPVPNNDTLLPIYTGGSPIRGSGI